MAKKYIVELTAAERAELLALTKSGKISARKFKRAQMLLLADEGKKDAEIAAVLKVGLRTVERTRQRCVLEGLPAALNEKPRPGAQAKLDAKGEAMLEMLAKSEPPQGQKRWTLQLLADRLVELQVIESISDETVRNLVKKNGLNYR
jgi:transposase